MSRISLVKKEICQYPSCDFNFCPDTLYPEYPFSSNDMSNESNIVYGMVRESFYQMGFDIDNYGKRTWNPLGDIISENDVVLVKPNWVMDENKAMKTTDGLNCLVTHPSVLRVVIDYVIIALKGTGKVIVADAPMQDCDFDNLLEKMHYNQLFDFYKSKNISIVVKDLRKYSSVFENGVIVNRKDNSAMNSSVLVELNGKSMHNSSLNVSYKVSDYAKDITQCYHNEDRHAYEINSDALSADVIISMPKPKCHRLAGMTAALKNTVGIIYDKACLPHRKLGSPHCGGDSYMSESKFKNLMQIFDEKKTNAVEKRNFNTAKFWSFFEKASYVMGTLFTGDKSRVGGWYGNDTIWRTVSDLNYILEYANKDGHICNDKQRKLLYIGDMIICGQKNGPVSPIPKELGMVMISNNPFLFDMVMCKIMGFSYKAIKILNSERVMNSYGYESFEQVLCEEIVFNGERKTIHDIEFLREWRFEAHDMWKKHIEENVEE